MTCFTLRGAARLLSVGALGLTLAACSDTSSDAGPLAPDATRLAPDASPSRDELRSHGGDAGAVYTQTNAAAGNAVVAFRRAADGALTPLGKYATGGKGIGGDVDPLESQFAVALSEDRTALLAVNAGSDQLTSFRVGPDGGLTLASTVPSLGARPVSIASHGRLVYVLNAESNTLQGYLLSVGERLVPLLFARASLAAGASGGAAIRFTPDGRFLVVSERVSNRLEVFPVSLVGTLGRPETTASNGASAFGFDVTTGGRLVVSESQGTVSSYAVDARGRLASRTASLTTGGAAPCWVTVTADGRFAYVANAGSGFLAGYAVDGDGRLKALTPGAPTGDDGAGSTPLDIDHVDSRFVYALEAGAGTIGAFAVKSDGTLAPRAHTPAGAPASGMQGLAAF